MLTFVIWLVGIFISIFLFIRWTLVPTNRIKAPGASFSLSVLFALGWKWRDAILSVLALEGSDFSWLLVTWLLPFMSIVFFACTLLLIYPEDEGDDWHTIAGSRPDRE